MGSFLCNNFWCWKDNKHCIGVTSDITDMEGNIRNTFLQTICVGGVCSKWMPLQERSEILVAKSEIMKIEFFFLVDS
jgi:hypothetical protein